MPVQPTYPGVYIEEIPSGVHTITGVATSITAFIGRALRGPVSRAILIESFADYERIFGGLWLESTMGYAVRDFYLNGGSQAIIVRIYAPYFATLADQKTARDAATQVSTSGGATAADVAAAADNSAKGFADDPAKTAASLVAKAADAAAKEAGATPDSVKKAMTAAVDMAAPVTNATLTVGGLPLVAAYPGTWGENLRATIDFDILDDVALQMGLPKTDLFNLLVIDKNPGGRTEKFRNVTLKESPLRVDKVLAAESRLVRWGGDPLPTDKPLFNGDIPAGTQKIDDSMTIAEIALAKAKKANNFANQQQAKSATDAIQSAVADAQQKTDVAQKAVNDAQAALDAANKVNPPVPADVKKAQDALTAAQTALATAQKALDNARAQKPVDVANKALSDAQAALDAANKVNPPVPADVKKAQDAVTAAQKTLDAAKNLTAAADAQTTLDTAKAAMIASDGNFITELDFTGPGNEVAKLGLYALEQADLFNLLCIPPYTATGDVDIDLVSEAAAYCERRRAMLLVDPLSTWVDKDGARTDFTDPNEDKIGTRSKNAALFFPRLRKPNILRNNQVEDFVPSGTVAGIFARTDSQRGVWKAPAGLEASLVGVPQLSVNLTDAENGELNPLGINCLRAFPIYGRVVWGSRTLRGADQFADEYKYIPVRRTALFIEESLYRGTQWVVFEPNDEPLWAQIRLNVGAFMHNLFRQGAFQGKTPREAYLVKCDSETTTQNDIDLGIVNILVAFAPLKPAEFVIIQIKQLAGQIEV